MLALARDSIGKPTPFCEAPFSILIGYTTAPSGRECLAVHIFGPFPPDLPMEATCEFVGLGRIVSTHSWKGIVQSITGEELVPLPQGWHGPLVAAVTSKIASLEGSQEGEYQESL